MCAEIIEAFAVFYIPDMYVRFMAFSNGDLEALYDKSEGFFRRQLILQTRRKPPGRVDDPYLSDKLKQEVEGIFLRWKAS